MLQAERQLLFVEKKEQPVPLFLVYLYQINRCFTSGDCHDPTNYCEECRRLERGTQLCSGGVPLSAVVFGYNEPSLVECLAWELPKMHSDFVEHLVKDTVFVGDAAMTQFLSENVCVVVNSPQVSSILLGGIVRAGNSYLCGSLDGVTEDREDEVFEAWLSVLGERPGLVEPSDVKYPPDALSP